MKAFGINLGSSAPSAASRPAVPVTARALAMLVVFALMLGAVLGPFAGRAAAETVRIATILSVSGTVEVKKAGGKKYFKAYKNMPLNAGDHLKTGDKSSVSIKVQDRGDEATLGAGSSLYISELKEKGGKKKSNFTLWTGSVWIKASSLVSTEEEFEVETPTAVMGVRGTTLFVTVDPRNGDSNFLIMSGVGVVQSKNPALHIEKNVSIYPGQTLMTYFNEEDKVSHLGTTIIDIDHIASLLGQETLKAIIDSKNKIDQENEELIKRLNSELLNGAKPEAGSLDVQNGNALERLIYNLDNLVSNIVKKAIQQQKVNGEIIRSQVNEANKNLDKIIVLDDNKPQQLSSEELARQKQVQQTILEREKKLQEEKEKALKMQQNAEEVSKQRFAELLKLTGANEQAAKDRQAALESEYIKSLKPEQAKAYEEAKKKLEAGETATSSPSSTTAPASTPTPVPTPTPDPVGNSPLNGTGTIAGPISQTVTGSGIVTYGPASGSLTINGNVAITGDAGATGRYDFRNLSISGNLNVNVPSGSVNLLNGVTVSGTTTIVDVASQTFRSEAAHGGEIVVADETGTRVILAGAASNSDVRVTGSGHVTLEGTYDGDITIEGAVETLVLKGQFGGNLIVSYPGVTIQVDEGTTFGGTLDIRAGGVKLTGAFGVIKSILLASGIEPDPSVQEAIAAIAAERLRVLNETDSAQEMLGMMKILGYGQATLWHAEKLIQYRNMEFYNGFENIQRAKEAIDHIMEQEPPLPAPLLSVSGAVVQGKDIAISFEENEGWSTSIYQILLQLLDENGQPGDEYGVGDDYTVTDNEIIVGGGIFLEFPPGQYRIVVIADEERYLPAYVTVTTTPIDYLNGEYEGHLPPYITSYVTGAEDRLLGPSDEWADENGPLEVFNLRIAGAGTGTYTIRNLVIRGDLTIDVPRGSVTLDKSVEFMSEGAKIWLEDISEGTNGSGGFTSYAQYLPFFIHVRDSNASRLELSPEDRAFRIPEVIFETAGQTVLAGTFDSIYIEVEQNFGEEEGNEEGNEEASEYRVLALSEGAVVQRLNLITPFLELGEVDGVILRIDTRELDEAAVLHSSVTEYMALLEEQFDKAREALFAESYSGEAKARFDEVLAFIGIKAVDILEKGEWLWEFFSSYGEEERPFDLYDLWQVANGRGL
ncbi:FecR domain-containing protein [Paenibacillus sp. CAU 1782]